MNKFIYTLLKSNKDIEKITLDEKANNEQLQSWVKGYFCYRKLIGERFLICDEDGFSKKKEINVNATIIYQNEGIHARKDEILVGDVIICPCSYIN